MFLCFKSVDQLLKTRDKILEEALRQLNEEGLDKVSIRSIAQALGISPGNLTYHFRNVDTIIQELYLELVRELDAGLQRMENATTVLTTLLEVSEDNFFVFWKYRFILLDFIAITRRITEVRDHFRRLIAQRHFQFKFSIEHMIAEGLLKPEEVDGQYDKLILQSIILGNAWIPDAHIHFDDRSDAVVRFYADLFLGMIVPYLTEKGLAEYRAWLDKRPKLRYKSYRTDP